MFQQRAKITYGQLLEYPEHKVVLKAALGLEKDQVNIMEEWKNVSQ